MFISQLRHVWDVWNEAYRLDRRSRIRSICDIEVICWVIWIEARALLNHSEVRDSLSCLTTVLTTTFLLTDHNVL